MDIQNVICHDCTRQTSCQEYWDFRDIQALYDVGNHRVRRILEWLIIGTECPHKIVEDKSDKQ